MRANPLKAKLAAGEYVIGPIINFASATMVELFAYAGYDFVVFDGEHGPLLEPAVEDLTRAAEAAGIVPLVRVPQNVPQVILRYLETGVLGLHVPQVNSRTDAETTVRSVKYHPVGFRGLAGSRWADYGQAGPITEQIARANEQTFIIVHVENIEGVRRLDEMLAVPEIDVFFIAPSDLSQSLGKPGQLADPEVVATVEGSIRRVAAAGRVAGTIVASPEAARQAMELGCRYLVVSAINLVMRGARGFLTPLRG